MAAVSAGKKTTTLTQNVGSLKRQLISPHRVTRMSIWTCVTGENLVIFHEKKTSSLLIIKRIETKIILVSCFEGNTPFPLDLD